LLALSQRRAIERIWGIRCESNQPLHSHRGVEESTQKSVESVRDLLEAGIMRRVIAEYRESKRMLPAIPSGTSPIMRPPSSGVTAARGGIWSESYNSLREIT